VRLHRDGPAPPVAIAHLGLGSFFRAHQAVYTDEAPGSWGIAAFAGRSAGLAGRLTAQDGLYTLLVQGPDGARTSVVSSVAQARAGADVDGWLEVVAAPATALVTLTVSEAAYLRTDGGRLDLAAVAADVAAVRSADLAAVRTVPGRLVAGLAARRRAGAGPIAVVPCDNLLGNGSAVRRVVLDLADAADDGLAGWIRSSVSFVDTEVDRITPRPTPADVATVARLTGVRDECPVVTEPFREWVLAGSFPAGRPGWDALFVQDVRPYEERKLWLLNGAHSLLAYAGSIRGHHTVAEAVADETCAGWMEAWWDEAARHLDLPAGTVDAYRAATRARFANPAMRHLLAQIASDGSQKLPVRVLPVVRAELAAGRVPVAGARALAAWVLHLRGAGAPVTDPRAADLTRRAAGPLPEAVRRVLDALDPALAADRTLLDAVLDRAAGIGPAV
jgi:fructuronate reductase